jgi:class 3 adenylate cyclase/pimeloyl-ACP methyl ester carboxylesterase
MATAMALPAGTVTLLFSDIEGSTRLLDNLGERYADVLDDHRRIVRGAIAEHAGHEVRTEGDAFFVAFTRATDAVRTAVAAQRALGACAWPDEVAVRVRMGVHTGEPQVVADDYVGMDVHCAARICSAAHGGQVLVSETTEKVLAGHALEGVGLQDLGEHRLKDLGRPLRLYQVAAEGLVADFAPLRAQGHSPSGLAAQRAEPTVPRETHFCTTPDGVALAFAIDGEGPPLVKAGNWMTHLDFERQSPVWRHWVRELSRGHTLIRYDERGCGLSDRQFDGTPTLDTFVDDLAAVIHAAGIQRFALLGVSGGGPIAIEYAVRHPDGVTQLVLYGTYALGRQRRAAVDADKSRVLMELTRVGWGGAVPAFRQVFSSIYIPSASEEQKRWYDELQQVSSTGEMAARLWQARGHIDITDTARRITQPTLILHARHDLAVPWEEGRRLASLLPNARFVTLESDNHILQEGEPAWEVFLSEVRAFLSDDERTRPQPTVAPS